jgi:ribosomal protein S18 acetylase RimI-like enzyme
MIQIMKIIHDKKLKKFIAYAKNKKVGYLKYTFPKDASAKNGNRNVQIDYVYVDPAYRHQGIASKLMSCMLEFSKNMVWVSLWTGRQAEIDKSFGLYRKFGFQQKSVQKDYYEDGIALRLFVKRMVK